MQYSKIVSIEVTNFMSFSNAKAFFDDSNILNIKGYNNSGKSSFLRALVVALEDKYRNKQIKCIRKGCSYFRIVVTFDDGVTILRDKYRTGQSLYELYKGEDLVYTTKQGERLAEVKGVPQVIKDYVGLCETVKGTLNYQTCVEPMFLVETKGSENYDDIHMVLKTEEISRASAMANSRKKDLNSEIANLEYELRGLQGSYDSCSYASEGLLLSIVDRGTRADTLIKRMDDSEKLESFHTALESIPSLPEVVKVDTRQLSAVTSIVSGLVKLGKIPVLPSVQGIHTRQLQGAYALYLAIQGVEGSVTLPEVGRVELSRYEGVFNLAGALSAFVQVARKSEKVRKEIDALDVQRQEAVISARKEGLIFTNCDSCGAYVTVKVGD